MKGTHRSPGRAAFVDQSGGRRRAVMTVGVLSGTLALAMAAILIGGAFTTTTLDAVERPGGDPGSSRPAGEPGTDRTTRPATPSRTARAAVTPGARPSPAVTRTAAPTRTRDAVRPSSAAPSSTRPAPAASSSAPAAEPSRPPGQPSGEPSERPSERPSQPGEPTDAERTPPGQTKRPDADKTRGPKS
ncbi:hypothetical protein HII36_46250 [Nonomuraea sp. NN258]|uniref:hypothetical protein n=1 Tax=Nonomuraea antri TaxID=2730852 RepID=UPI00156824A7|nr:hypothetical protein [Nonomuraea antri]NRQ39176.1 hypothetical protein [Nonomuraea antri]